MRKFEVTDDDSTPADVKLSGIIWKTNNILPLEDLFLYEADDNWTPSYLRLCTTDKTSTILYFTYSKLPTKLCKEFLENQPQLLIVPSLANQ